MDARTLHTMGAAGPESGYAPDAWALETARERLEAGQCPSSVLAYLRAYGLTHSAGCIVVGAVNEERNGAPSINAAMVSRHLTMAEA